MRLRTHKEHYQRASATAKRPSPRQLMSLQITSAKCTELCYGRAVDVFRQGGEYALDSAQVAVRKYNQKRICQAVAGGMLGIGRARRRARSRFSKSNDSFQECMLLMVVIKGF